MTFKPRNDVVPKPGAPPAVHAWVSAELQSEVRAAAEQNGLSMGEFVRRALRYALDNMEAE